MLLIYFLLCLLHITIQSLQWPETRLLASKPLFDPNSELEKQHQSSNLFRQFLEDHTILNLLSLLKGIPQNLSIDEVQQLRDHAPASLKKWSNLVNNEHLLRDLSHGRISQDWFDDLRRSINFLEISSCELQSGHGIQTCLLIRQPIPKPNDPIFTAHLVTHILPWINQSQIQLNAYLLNKHTAQLEQRSFDLNPVNESSNPAEHAAFREIRWDVTALVNLFYLEQANIQYPILMTLQYSDSGLVNFEDSDNAEPVQILAPNAQAFIEIQTIHTKQLQLIYSRRRISGRSLSAESIAQNRANYCPSFLDLNERETKCCLFRYTLNKKQMDQNDKLRFIIFPHHLPMNMCHGRCIGLFMPTDNAHTILMNRYFSGLGASERMKIYNSMPCCAANDSIPFTIVYRNDQKQLVTETLFNAVKTNCACR